MIILIFFIVKYRVKFSQVRLIKPRILLFEIEEQEEKKKVESALIHLPLKCNENYKFQTKNSFAYSIDSHT